MQSLQVSLHVVLVREPLVTHWTRVSLLIVCLQVVVKAGLRDVALATQVARVWQLLVVCRVQVSLGIIEYR